MTSSRGRRIQSRRAIAILTWVSLVGLAVLLWYARTRGVIRIQAWEPAALVLSAYATFLSIFCWLLFSPERKSAEESPALFFAGLLTLIPPCFIAYFLMPPGAPLRPWLTGGVFVFGVLAILSPLPEEVFRIPRDRRSYLRPLTDAYLSDLDVEPPSVDFDAVAPRTVYRLTEPAAPAAEPREVPARDPWTDPFRGTGRRLSSPGTGSRSDTSARDRAFQPGAQIPLPQLPLSVPESPPPLPTDQHSTVPVASPRSVSYSASGISSPGTITEVTPAMPGAGFGSIPVPTEPARLRERTPVTGFTGPAAPGRRPLRDPESPKTGSVGFQTPVRMETPSAVPRTDSGASVRVIEPISPAPAPAAQFTPALPSIVPPVSLPPASVAPAILTPRVTPPAPVARTDEVVRPVARPLRDPALDEEADSSPGEARAVSQSPFDLKAERIRDELGGEMIEGTVTARFEAGQKRVHLHIPFAPSLPGVPEVECEPANNDPVRVKVGVRHPYGIRIEVRRTEAAEPLDAEISFAAVYTPGRTS